MNISIRRSEAKDLPTLSAWISADATPQHRGVDPAWWVTGEPNEDVPMGAQTFAIENENGPVFYLRCETVMRCYIQFAPDGIRDKETTAHALKDSFLKFARGAKQLGYSEMIFDSRSRGLINLFENLGFREAKDNFLVRL